MLEPIQRCWNFPQGTLHATYQYNESKEKYKLDHFSLNGTSISLSKIFINTYPATYLKGIKSHLLDEKQTTVTQTQDLIDLTLNPFPFKTFSVSVKFFKKEGEETFNQTVPHHLKGPGLTKTLARKLGIHDDSSLRTKYQGEALDPLTLEEMGLSEGDQITLEFAEKQDIPEKISNTPEEAFKSFACVNPEAQRTIPFGKAPPWRWVIKGLNIKGECTNKTCEAFSQVIYIQKGIGTFNMAQEVCLAKCPQCKEDLEKEPTNFGFYDCKYTIIGTKINKEKKKENFEKKDQLAPKDAFLTFKEVVDGESMIAEWIFLNVITEKRD